MNIPFLRALKSAAEGAAAASPEAPAAGSQAEPHPLKTAAEIVSPAPPAADVVNSDQAAAPKPARPASGQEMEALRLRAPRQGLMTGNGADYVNRLREEENRRIVARRTRLGI